jgi:hypothetical protein
MYIAEYNIHNKQDWGDIMKVEVGTVVGNLTVIVDLEKIVIPFGNVNAFVEKKSC